MERDRGKYNEETEIQNEPTDPVTAFLYILFGAMRLSTYDKFDLIQKITMFSRNTDDFKNICALLSSKAGLDDDYVDKIMGCIRNDECRTKLIQLIGLSPSFRPLAGQTNPPAENE